MHVNRIVVVGLLVAAACATNPATGRRQLILISEAEEVALGKQVDADVRRQMPLYRDESLQRYVDAIGQRLARSSHRTSLPWSFAVVDEPAVNAFALPGGFIFLTRGILPFLRDESELAAVLGHEIGHVDARHSAEAYSNQTLAGGGLAVAGILFPETQPFQGLAGLSFGLLFLKHGREAELEADGLGVRYAATHGWAPTGMPGLLETLARLDEASGSSRGVPNWALTHPPAADRVEKVQMAVAAARSRSATATNRTTLEQHLDGLVFGDSREKGLVRGRDFLHPVLRFALRFPAGWEVINTDEQVVARRDEAGNAGVVLQLAREASGSVEQTARAAMTQAGYRQTAGERTTINGLDAYVGTYDGSSGGTRVILRAAHIRSDQQTYVVAGITGAAEFAALRPSFDECLQSFRALSRDEADRIQPSRVDFYVVRSGDTWQSIASRASEDVVKASTLAIMNGRDPGSAPRSGERIRIVVGG